jgi:hypothetical protein
MQPALWFGPLGLSLAVALAGCSSTSSPSGETADSGPTSCSADAGTNPYGVEYPCENIGTSPRKDTIRGSQIANFSFQGYPNGDMSKGLQPISLADFYDPEGKLGYKLLELGVAAIWCTACDQETKAIVPLVSMYQTEGVVFAQTLAFGAEMTTPATTSDLDTWVTEHKSNFTEMLDPGDQELGSVVDLQDGTLPWNAVIDTRSMEILQAGTGYDGIGSEISPWLTWVAQNPSSY